MRFGYTNQIAIQTWAINQALKQTGIQVDGYNYSWSLKNANTESGQGRAQDPLVVTVLIKDKVGTVVESYTYDYSQFLAGQWYDYSGTQVFSKSYLGADLSEVQFSVRGQDAGYWAGYYGPEFRLNSFSLNWSLAPVKEDPCTKIPVTDPSCSTYIGNTTTSTTTGGSVATGGTTTPTTSATSSTTTQSAATTGNTSNVSTTTTVVAETFAVPTPEVTTISATTETTTQQAATTDTTQQQTTASSTESSQQQTAASSSNQTQPGTSLSVSQIMSVVSNSVAAGGTAATGGSALPSTTSSSSAASNMNSPANMTSPAATARRNTELVQQAAAAAMDTSSSTNSTSSAESQAVASATQRSISSGATSSAQSVAARELTPEEKAENDKLSSLGAVEGFSNYTSKTLTDADFYKATEIYAKVRIKENKSALRMGLASEVLWDRMVEQQYNREKK
jgi:hypothetical protein